jgi:hypothetical protein
MVEMDGVVGAGRQENLGGGVFEGKVGTWGYSTGRLREHEGTVYVKGDRTLSRLEEILGQDKGAYAV